MQLTAASLLMAVCLGAGAAASSEPLDLRGSWFVLIHFRDPETAHPEAMRWKDLVWSFARKGNRLEWTEYPIVVFEDSTGRFEGLGGAGVHRVIGAWEPTPGQLRAIENGPRVNPRGVKIKTMSGSDARGWHSSQRRAQTSASVMGYHESVRVEQLDGLPVFERSDVVGNDRSGRDGGTTLYQVTEIKPGGRRLVGRYERDGRLEGRFEMRRTPPHRGLKKREGTPNQRAAEALMGGLETAP